MLSGVVSGILREKIRELAVRRHASTRLGLFCEEKPCRRNLELP